MRIYSIPISTSIVAGGAFAAGDLVANSLVAGNVTPLTFNIPAGFLLTSLKIDFRCTGGLPAAPFPTLLLWLFKYSPTVVNGSNAAFLLNGGASGKDFGFLGNILVDTSQYSLTTQDTVGITSVDPNATVLVPDDT